MRAFMVVGITFASLGLSPVSANNPASGSLQRASRTDGSKRTGCQVANFERTPGDVKYVSVEGYLDAFNARTRVRPSSSGVCQYNMFTHNTTMKTTCWDGRVFDDAGSGGVGSPGNLTRDCSARQGGRGMMFYLTIRGGS